MQAGDEIEQILAELEEEASEPEDRLDAVVRIARLCQGMGLGPEATKLMVWPLFAGAL